MSSAARMEPNWWQSFFDGDYIRIWSGMMPEAESKSHCDGLWTLLQLHDGSRVLDAACGYGRLARPLAERGAVVVGVDQSADLLAHAERTRGDIPESRLKYMRHDLRYRLLTEEKFDAAFNVFTSIGFGTEEDDRDILMTLHDAICPGGLVLLEAIQRDAVTAFMARGGQQSVRFPDGTILLAQSTFDAISNRITGTWYWSGAGVSGEKSATMRVYTVGELLRLVESVDLEVRGTFLGISTKPFQEVPPEMGGRVGILAQRPE